ncbi:MAG: hypothetical protein R3F19_15045 [Verrucomicrobiales bacterium]
MVKAGDPRPHCHRSGWIVFAGILQQLAAQVNAVGSIADNLQQTLTAADRVYEILDAEPEIADRPDAASWSAHAAMCASTK